MAIEKDLEERIAAITNSPSVRVMPVGNLEDTQRGILKATGRLGAAVKAAFAGTVIAAALATGGISNAEAAGVGYDANVYGQAQGQVMQQGSAIRMQVVDVQAVKIEVAPQQRSTGGQVADYAITGAGSAVGAIIGNQMGRNSSSGQQIGAIIGGLVGGVAANFANDALRGRSNEAQMIDGVALTMVNPANNRLSTITQAGTTQFSPGDAVLVIQTGGSYRVVPDRSQARGHDRSYGQNQGQVFGGAALDQTVDMVVGHAKMMGILVDANAVAVLCQTGVGKDGLFIGKVVGVDHERGLVYQSMGRGMGVVHSARALDHVPTVGDMVEVRMNGGRGTVSGGVEQGRNRGRGF